MLCYFSISTALAMTYAGARRKTAYEMRQVLRFRRLKFNIHASFRATLGSMNASHGKYTLALANGVFVDTRYSIRPSFHRDLAKYYSASFKLLEFDKNPKASADYINRWVENKTNDKIKNIVSPADVAGANVALANAIYFKGKWKFPFDLHHTVSVLFHVASEQRTSVHMMTQTARFNYKLNRRLHCQILELPYEGDRLAMYILLPTKKDGLAALESKLTYRSVTSALARMRRRRLAVAIPRFEMTVGKRLPELLIAMGMRLAFTGVANFNGIGRRLHISDVIHKAFIGVDEEGTEAAAATVVVLRHGPQPRPLDQDFIADHPFLFLIRDSKTKSILFLGRLVNPAAK